MDSDSAKKQCIYYTNNDKYCSKKSILKNNFCIEHQHYKDYFNKYCEIDKKIVTEKIISLLDKHKLALGKVNQGKIFTELYDFLCKHKLFLYLNDTISKSAYFKLLELQNDNKYFNADYYIHKLFPNFCSCYKHKTGQSKQPKNIDDQSEINIQEELVIYI